MYVLVPVALSLAGGAARVWSPELCLDDSYIHLAYARSLRLGQGLSYNPHDWETGATSPLWVLLLALWPAGPPEGVALKLFGLVWHALASALFALLTCELVTPVPGACEPGSATRLSPRALAALRLARGARVCDRLCFHARAGRLARRPAAQEAGP